MSLVLEEVKDSFGIFSASMSSFMPIRTKQHYKEALTMMENLLLSLDDSGDDPLNNLLDIIARSVDEYENQSSEVQLFLQQTDSLCSGITVLRVLMDQYNLSMNDFQNEIGKKSYISMILKGKRELSKKHIGKLCERFKISPNLFY